MSKQPPPAPTVSAVGPCPTVIQILGRQGTGSLPSTNFLLLLTLKAPITTAADYIHKLFFRENKT